MTPEEKARQQIDTMLIASGWSIQDYKAYNPLASRGVALREVPLKSGRCDYLLLVDRKPVGIVEAKREEEGKNLSVVAEQSAAYGENLPDFLRTAERLPFYYESTGVETFFRDERDPAPRSRRVFSFHRPETLAAWAAEPDTLRARLAKMPVAHPLPTNGMRDCQVEAITDLETSFADDRLRALIQMEEMLYYKTKEEERPKVWGKSVGTNIQVGVSKIRHGENGGKATLLGTIIAEPKK